MRHFSTKTLSVVIGVGLFCLPSLSIAETRGDNTKVNERDRSSFERTADSQGNDKKDIEVTRQIRQLILRDKSMSTYAQNIKVITSKGVVTIKGSVKTQVEMKRILRDVRNVAGTANIIDEMEVVKTNM